MSPSSMNFVELEVYMSTLSLSNAWTSSRGWTLCANLAREQRLVWVRNMRIQDTMFVIAIM